MSLSRVSSLLSLSERAYCPGPCCLDVINTTPRLANVSQEDGQQGAAWHGAKGKPAHFRDVSIKLAAVYVVTSTRSEGFLKMPPSWKGAMGACFCTPPVAGVLATGGGIHTLLYNINQSVFLGGAKQASEAFIYNHTER